MKVIRSTKKEIKIEVTYEDILELIKLKGINLDTDNGLVCMSAHGGISVGENSGSVDFSDPLVVTWYKQDR